MKKLLIAMILAVLLALSSVPVLAGSTVTETWNSPSINVTVITWRWQADAYTATVSPETSDNRIRGYVFMVVTDPTAVTDNYDITLSDENNCDIMGGELANRDRVNSEQAVPKIGGAYGSRYVSGPVTMNILNNAVSSGSGIVSLFFYGDK